MATATKLGDFFQYALDKPVSLPRQKSALLPIINKDVEGTRVSIYNERTQAKFPLLGLKFKNTSGMHLSQGPITVFDGSNYAGDSRILDVEPNEERLLSYAVDLGMEVNPVLVQRQRPHHRPSRSSKASSTARRSCAKRRPTPSSIATTPSGWCWSNIPSATTSI